MRNLAVYPITPTEKLLKIDELIEAATAKLQGPDAPVGGTELAVLQEIKKDIQFASDESNRRIVREHHSASSMRSMAAQMNADIAPR